MKKIKKQEKIRAITFALGIFLVAVPLDSLQLFGSVSILRILAIIPIILSFFYVKDFKTTKSVAYLAVFVFYIFAQNFFTIDNSVTKQKFQTFFMYFILLFFCTSIKYNRREIRFLEKMFAFSAITSCILVIFFGVFTEGRLSILMNKKREDENQFSGYFLAGSVYFLKNILNKNKVILCSIGLGLSLLIILMTGSRGGLLAVIVALGTYILFYSKNDKQKIKKILIGLVAGIIIILSIGNLLKFISPEIAERFSIKNVQESGGTGRTEIWNFYIRLFNESPLLRQIFGYGSGTAAVIYRVAHNNWIELLIETGIVGTCLYAVVIISFAINAYKNNNIFLFSVLVGYISLTISLSLFSYKPIWGAMILIMLKEIEKNMKLSQTIN